MLEHRYFFAGNLRRINCSCDPSDDPSVKSFGKKYTFKTSTDKETSDRLRRLVHPFILRRLKKDVLKELPDKIEKVVSVHLEGEQKKLYDAYAQRLKLYLAKQSPEEFRQSKLEILKELTRLRQLCCGPSLFLEHYHSENAKLDTCMELVKQAIENGHKILLFSQFTSVLDELQKAFKHEQILNLQKAKSDLVEEILSGDGIKSTVLNRDELLQML